jgi:hypothetical protein
MIGQLLLALGVKAAQLLGQRLWGLRFGERLQITLQDLQPLARAFQQKVGPGPTLGIVGLCHLAAQLLQARQVRMPPSCQPAAQLFDVRTVDAVQPTRHLEVFGQTFIEPQRQIRHDRVQVSVGHLVAQIFSHAIPPVGIDIQARIAFNEESPPLGQRRIVHAHVGFELLSRRKEIDVDRLVRYRQAEFGAQ